MYKKYIIKSNIIDLLDEPEKQQPSNADKENMTEKLIEYIFNYNVNSDPLKADKIEDIFYPYKKCQIFISHSGKDKEKANRLANWLYTNFGINSFIDSNYWGCMNVLQQKIDEKLCKHNENTNTWDYDDRNYSTAYVHMLLCNSLSEMIRRCECFIFIDSSNSITYDLVGKEKNTASPWIFHELYTVNTIEPKTPPRLLNENFSKSRSYKPIKKQTSILFNICDEIKNLYSIDYEMLQRWRKDVNDKKISDSLGYLYKNIEHNDFKMASQLLFEKKTV